MARYCTWEKAAPKMQERICFHSSIQLRHEFTLLQVRTQKILLLISLQSEHPLLYLPQVHHQFKLHVPVVQILCKSDREFIISSANWYHPSLAKRLSMFKQLLTKKRHCDRMQLFRCLVSAPSIPLDQFYMILNRD